MSLPLPTGTYAADAVHSNVSFSIRHLGLARLRGSFSQFEAELVVGEDLTSTSVTATIEVASVNTGNSDRDAHMQGDDFFAAEQFPQMKFTSTSIEETGDGYTLSGEMDMHGHIVPIILTGTFLGTSVFPMDQSDRAGFSFTGEISRKAHGMEFDAPAGVDKLMLGDKAVIELDLQFVL